MTTNLFTIATTLLSRVGTVLLTISLVVALLPSGIVYANSNRLFITPNSSQMNTNTTFIVNVRSYSDSDQASGRTQGAVTFPSQLLQVTGTSTNGSAYGSPSISQGAGVINFSGVRNPAQSGVAHIFSITFKTTSAGIATVGFTDSSKVNNSTTTYTNGVFTITSPTPPAPSPSAPPRPSTFPSPVTPIPSVSTPTPTPSPSPTPEVEAAQTPDPTGVVDNVVVQPSYTSVTVTWKVNASNPTSTFSYGTKSSSLENKAEVERKSDGSFSATIKNIKPGSRHYYSIAGAGDANKSGTYSGTVTANGFPVLLTITENNLPAERAQIKINNRTYTTSTDGKLSIGLAAGSYAGTIVTDTSSLTVTVVVADKAIPSDGSAPERQSFTYNLTSSALAQGPGSTVSILSFIGILGIGTVIIGFAFVAFIAHRRRKLEQDGVQVYTNKSPASSVIIEDGYSWHEPTAQTGESAEPTENTVARNDSTHSNSVHMTDEEPLDMFEQAKLNQERKDTDNTQSTQ